MKHNMRGQHIIILCIHTQTGLSSQSVINFLGCYSKSGQLEGCLSTQNKVNSILVDGKKLPVASILTMILNLLNSPCNEPSIDSTKLSSCDVTSGSVIWRQVLCERKGQDRGRWVGVAEGYEQHGCVLGAALGRPLLALGRPFLSQFVQTG